jgi:hypothetical protein
MIDARRQRNDLPYIFFRTKRIFSYEFHLNLVRIRPL